jgi:hypothetical protein
MNCSCCGEVLEEDADGDPYTYGPEEDLCSDCYHDQYKFICCACEDYGQRDDQHKFTVVFDKEAGVAPGIYRITHYPYYVDAMLYGWLIRSSLELLVSLPFQWLAYMSTTGRKVYRNLVEGGEPSGYLAAGLCADCQKTILNQLRKCE